MKLRALTGIAIGILILPIFFSSCSFKKDAAVNETFISIDKQMDSLVKFLGTKPDTVFNTIDLRKKISSDSIFYYYWEAYKSKMYFYTYNDNMAFKINDIVIDFCERKYLNAQKNKIIPEANLFTLWASAHNMKGVYQQLLNEKEKSLEHYSKAYYYVYRGDFRDEIPNICINAGNVCKMMGKLPDAVLWAKRAIVAADSLGMDNMKNPIYVNLGEIYTQMANYNEADRYYAFADKLFPPVSDYEYFVMYTSMGNSYYFRQD